MLVGKVVTLRPVREADLEGLYRFHLDLASRGEYYPRGVESQTAFLRQFREDGFWGREEGTLLMVSAADEPIGHIEFFKTVNYLDELELGYQVYDRANRGKGIATEAVNLMVRYLFETKQVNRIRLIIHPDNTASRRLAERCGFRHEGTARGAWYNRGRHHDVEVYAILKAEVIGG
jgi:RimJ/RimL family protein N-acetyltransferase